MAFAVFGNVIHSIPQRDPAKISRTLTVRSQRWGEAMTAVDDFFHTLSFLLRPGDPSHNNAMIADFAKASGISETEIRERLAKTLLPDGAKQ